MYEDFRGRKYTLGFKGFRLLLKAYVKWFEVIVYIRGGGGGDMGCSFLVVFSGGN